MISILDSLPPVVAYSVCLGVGGFIGAVITVIALVGYSNGGSDQ